MLRAQNLMADVITMNEIGMTRKRRICLTVLAAFIVAYAATWSLGVRAVKTLHKEELRGFYKKQKLYHSDHKTELANNVFWKDMMEHHNGFPTWEEYRLWNAEQKDDRYYAIFPFVVLSWREGKHVGENEYHAWSIVDAHLIGRQLRWIE